MRREAGEKGDKAKWDTGVPLSGERLSLTFLWPDIFVHFFFFVLFVFRRSRKWFDSHHSDTFYVNYVNILMTAEERGVMSYHALSRSVIRSVVFLRWLLTPSSGIYTLPGEKAAKFSMKNIKKFDLIDSHESDLAVDEDSDSGNNNNNNSSNDHNNNSDTTGNECNEEESDIPAWLTADENHIPLNDMQYDQKYLSEYLQQINQFRERITNFTNASNTPLTPDVRLTLSKNGQKKTILLPHRTMNEIAKAVKQKFQCRAKKITLASGELVQRDEQLCTLANDSVLFIV